MEDQSDEGVGSYTPDATLAQLYKSARPCVELLPGLSLSAMINSTWLVSDAKTMLESTWMPAASQDSDSAAPPPPSFDPKSIDYKVGEGL